MPTRATSVLTADSKQKKGIKSSIGRLFGKKKEGGGRLEPTVSRDGQALPALTGLTPASASAWKTTYKQSQRRFKPPLLSFRFRDGYRRHNDAGQTGHTGRKGPQDEEEVGPFNIFCIIYVL